MAQPIYQQITGIATTGGVATALLIDYAQTPFNVSFACEILNSTATYGVQFTLDDPNAATDVGFPGYLGTANNTTVTWFGDVNVPAGTQTSAVGNYMFPIRALRVNIASCGSGFAMQFAVLQGYPASG